MLAACAGLSAYLVRPFMVDKVIGRPATTWEDVASKVTFVPYRPSYLPPDAGTPGFRIFRPYEHFEEVVITYENGLVIKEGNFETENNLGEEQPTQVRGAEEARFDKFDERTLVFRKVDTWVMLSGVSDEELLRVAESMDFVLPPLENEE